MNRTMIMDLAQHIGTTVTINGWVSVRRDQGKMVFFDFRDRSGTVQGVVLPNSPAMEIAKQSNTEYVVSVTGNVNARPEKNIQIDKQNGNIELEVTGMEIINTSETLPFEISSDTSGINEETRLTYRYLDLRSDRLQKTLKNRSSIQHYIRNYFFKSGFTEVETPLMSASTPEGSRSYIVPSRLWKGNFYSLPQSPQQYKQLLMVAGIERYFQFAHCMRDEDTRGDRQPEFTQLDLEMSFATESEIMDMNEQLLIELVQNFYPEKTIQEIPFPRISYADAMSKYGNDRPDVRTDKNDPNLLAFCWVTDFPAFEKTDGDNVDGTGDWTFTHNPFTRVRDEYMYDYMAGRNIDKLISTQYDIVLNGFEIGGGGLRNYKPETLKKTFEIMGYSDEKIEKMFGHMITAMQYGAPSHGGIAWGFDRFIMLMQNEPNIREVMAFPKTGEGRDPMMNAPAGVSDKQLEELAIVMKKQA